MNHRNFTLLFSEGTRTSPLTVGRFISDIQYPFFRMISKFKDAYFRRLLGLRITVSTIHSWSSGAKCNYKPQQKIDICVQNTLWFDTICIYQNFKSVIKGRNWGHWKLPRNNLFVMYLDYLIITLTSLPHQTFAGRILNVFISYLAQHLFKKIIYGIW